MKLVEILPEWIERSGLLSSDCVSELLEFPEELLSGQCVRQLLSRLFGSVIVLGSILIKLPQLVVIWAGQSARGVSLSAELFMMAATFSSLAYGHLKRFPLSAYGDSYSLFLQTFLLIILILRYEYQRKSFVTIFVLATIVSSYALFNDIIPARVIIGMNALGVLMASISKLIQIKVNHRNQSTGQLSMITLLLMLAGSLARIFTSMEETGDWTLIATYTLMTVCNAILVCQVGYYWNGPKGTQDENDKKPKTD